MKMKYATTSRLGRNNAKLLAINHDIISHLRMRDLVDLVPEDAILVVNQAATLPASFQLNIGSLPVEIRLVRNLDDTMSSIKNWQALIFYRGSWRDRTEDRHDPDFLEIGDIAEIEDFEVEVTRILHPSKRLIEIEFKGDTSSIWNKIYKFGKPIQYSHLTEELKLWDVQTIFSSSPVAVEPPSASFQFNWEIVNKLVAKGIEIVGITHATSISSIGIGELDDTLPLPENYVIPEETAKLIQSYIEDNKPVVAIGTSVTRALEDNYMKFQQIKSGTHQASLKITKNHQRRVVTTLFTGMHLPEEAHIDLLLNFLSRDVLEKAYSEATQRDYLWHEYGDVSLITTPRLEE